MNRYRHVWRILKETVPRASGDEPQYEIDKRDGAACSPRQRG